MHRPRVIVIDDQRAARNALRDILRMEGYRVEVADSGRAALNIMPRFAPNFVVSDLMMPGMDGDTFVDLARKLGCPFRAIIVSGLDGAEKLAAAVDADFLPKPIEVAKLLELLERGVSRLRALEEQHGLTDSKFTQTQGQNHDPQTGSNPTTKKSTRRNHRGR
jgi:CheY-like chemotaxis protein